MPEPAERPSLPPGPYLVVGLGRAGIAAASALADRFGGSAVRGCDLAEPIWMAGELARLRERGASLRTECDGRDLLSACRCVVKSPGLPFEIPVLSRAAELGLPVIDELELGWRLSRAPIAAVTGTNGKSTVCALVMAAAERAGREPLLAGNTTFGPPLSAVPADHRGLVVGEVSSYQLEGCTEFLPDAAALTNVSRDHLERHRTLGAYTALKKTMLTRGHRAVRWAVLNADDPRCREIAAELEQRDGTVVRFGLAADAEYRLLDCDWTLTTGWLEAQTPSGRVRLNTLLPGSHNAANVLTALALCEGLGIELGVAAEAMERTPGVPGRFELIDEGQPYDVIVDYAHSEAAIAEVLSTLRTVLARRGSGRLRVLVSASGIHSRGGRRPMGTAAGKLADHVTVTAGNPRGEDASTTLDPLFAGARSTGNRAVEVIADRREAIRAAVERARPGDVVAILGRGAMPRLLEGMTGDGDPFDDRVITREAIAARLASTSRRARAPAPVRSTGRASAHRW